MIIFARRPHFNGYFKEEAPFYWVNLGGGWCSFFIYAQNYAGGWLEFHFMVHSLLGGLVPGHLDQGILLLWPYSVTDLFGTM